MSNMDLKHIMMGILLVLLVVITSGCTNSSSTYSGPTKTYSGNNISFNYPENWQVNDSGGSGGVMGIQVYNPEDKYKTNMISIRKGTKLNNNSLKLEYINSSFEEEVNSNIEHVGSDIVSKKNLTINGMRAYEIIFTPGNVKAIRIILEAKSEQVYVFGMSSASGDFENTRQYLDLIVNSFKLQ